MPAPASRPVTVAQTAHNLASALQLHPSAARYLVTAYAAQLGYAVPLPGPADDALELSAEDARYMLDQATDLAARQATRDEAALRDLQGARVELDAARTELDRREHTWRAALVHAVTEGWPLTMVARVAGVSRSRVHQIAQEHRG